MVMLRTSANATGRVRTAPTADWLTSRTAISRHAAAIERQRCCIVLLRCVAPGKYLQIDTTAGQKGMVTRCEILRTTSSCRDQCARRRPRSSLAHAKRLLCLRRKYSHGLQVDRGHNAAGRAAGLDYYASLLHCCRRKRCTAADTRPVMLLSTHRCHA